MGASIFTRPTRKKVSRAPASNARSTSATQIGSKPAAFTASATSASLPATTTNGGPSTSSSAAARSLSKSTAKPSSNTTNPPSLWKAVANASAKAHSPFKPMTPKASSATKTSASNAWTSEHGPHFCLMKITQDVRKYATEQDIAEEEALKKGMEERPKEFVEKGAEVYA